MHPHHPHLTRRQVIAAAASLAAPWLSSTSYSQTPWPSRPLRLIDVFAPGGSSDLIARATAIRLSPKLGQPITVENRGGAGGTIGTDTVAKSQPDGYTLLLTTTAMPTNSSMGKKLPFDLAKDFAPVGMIASTPLLVVVPMGSPIKSLRDLIDRARAQPNSIKYGSSGIGSLSHIGMELLAAQAKVQMLHVPYKGVSLTLADLMTGRLDALLGSFTTFSSFLESGKLRGLAVAGLQRASFAPDLPTAAEAGFPGFEIDYWMGMMAPAHTPAEVVKRLNQDLNTILAQDDMVQSLATIAAAPRPGSPEEFGKLINFELTRWGKLIKDAGITAD